MNHEKQILSYQAQSVVKDLSQTPATNITHNLVSASKPSKNTLLTSGRSQIQAMREAKSVASKP